MLPEETGCLSSEKRLKLRSRFHEVVLLHKNVLGGLITYSLVANLL